MTRGFGDAITVFQRAPRHPLLAVFRRSVRCHGLVQRHVALLLPRAPSGTAVKLFSPKISSFLIRIGQRSDLRRAVKLSHAWTSHPIRSAMHAKNRIRVSGCVCSILRTRSSRRTGKPRGCWPSRARDESALTGAARRSSARSSTAAKSRTADRRVWSFDRDAVDICAGSFH